jgi:GDP/UDP-N,N'-diacetylbacillosamine 2-epimerase (hydrolysing)
MSKIAVITGNRADYWLLRPLMSLLQASQRTELSIIATGAHLKDNGLQVIEKDGFKVAAVVECSPQEDTHFSMTQAIATGIHGFASTFQDLSPDLVVLLGDRFETLTAAISAYGQKIPIAHIHGGEVTFGSLDEGFRHAISKFSHIHFVSHQSYADRLIRMGEAPETVHVVGAIGLDNLANLEVKQKDHLLEELSLPSGDYILVTLHSSTLDDKPSNERATALIEALDSFKENAILITMSNPDPGGQILNTMWQEWSNQQPERVFLIPTLGDNYLQMVAHAQIVIGNSSSGILEVPYLDTPVINIGKRQEGRVMPDGIIQSDYNATSIRNAIQSCKLGLKSKSSRIYGTPGDVAPKICRVLEATSFNNIIYKKFYDAE